jgi:undecaprenyl diphosphate synthase
LTKNFLRGGGEMNSVHHLAIIMDGNGRWAEQRGMPRWKGHEVGAKAVRRTTEEAARQGIEVLTLFAFSSENWKRPAKEVQILFSLLRKYLIDERRKLVENGIRLSAIGRRDRLPGAVREALHETEDVTRTCKKLHVRLALDYGARYEIIEAVRALARQAVQGGLRPEQIDEAGFSERVSPEPVPDPDLIIRTAGEQRLSNFLLWQAAYAELHFCPKYWPDFEGSDLVAALADYHSRTRKFGALAYAAG